MVRERKHQSEICLPQCPQISSFSFFYSFFSCQSSSPHNFPFPNAVLSSQNVIISPDGFVPPDSFVSFPSWFYTNVHSSIRVIEGNLTYQIRDQKVLWRYMKELARISNSSTILKFASLSIGNQLFVITTIERIVFVFTQKS